jgi:hypothetical protein
MEKVKLLIKRWFRLIRSDFKKRTNRVRQLAKPFQNERGEVHILLFSLISIVAVVLIWCTIFNWMSQIVNMNRSKNFLDHATSAAATDINVQQQLQGKIIWDTAAGTADFYKYLRLNLKLNSLNVPQSGSYLSVTPIVQDLEFVTAVTYPSVIHRSIILYASTPDQITRHVDVTIYGPSVVAILEVRQNLIGLGKKEPILISSVASARFR